MTLSLSAFASLVLTAIAACALIASASRVSTASDAQRIFVDESSRADLQCRLQNSPTPEKHQIETMAGGVAAFDYDNDGYPDVYFANGAPQPSLKKDGPQYSNRLYRNRGNGTFEDVTEKVGVGGNGYDVGVAAGDYNNDGNEDLFVAGVRGNTLFRNRGDGTFENVTKRSGITSAHWSIAAAWFDYDNDGRLDLFVVDYVQWDPATEQACGDLQKNLRTYCHPRFYAPSVNHLFHNNGNGTFNDVSRRSGIANLRGKGMGVAIADYDRDGWPDVFIANDTLPNFLLHNEHGDRFTEAAMQAGVALNDDGKALSAMGVDFRDLDNDGADDLVITALTNETFPYFRNTGKGFFVDLTYSSRIGAASLAFSGWGVGCFDFNNDGWKDVLIAGGDVQDNTEAYSSRQSKQQNLLLLNSGKGSFQASLVGAPSLHRGVAFADFDRDGHVDAVITRLGQPPVFLHNASRNANGWLDLKLVGRRSNRDAIGARISIETPALVQTNHVTTSVGYASSSELVVHFGLGAYHRVNTIVIEWPSGKKQSIKNMTGDRRITVAEP